jgi:hypothetical protein
MMPQYRMFRSLLTALLGLGLWPSMLAAQQQQQSLAPANDTILRDELRADLFFLASDEMRGRLTASAENLLTSAFLRSRFERLGLEPMGQGGSYYQTYRLTHSSLPNETEGYNDNEIAIMADDGNVLSGGLGHDFYPLRFSASGLVEAEATFVGYGIHAPKLGHDDYAGDHVRGRIALVLDHEPGEEDEESVFDGVVYSEYSRDLRKALYAQNAGAVGIVFVTDLANHDRDGNFSESARSYWPQQTRRIARYTLSRWVERVRIPVVRFSPSMADALVAASGRSLEELARAAEQVGFAPVPIASRLVRLSTNVVHRDIDERNVVAAIRGEDPTLRDEWVIVCAHFDHDGAEGERVFNGADDDGSGTVALVEIAEAFATAASEGVRPRRSVLFAAWNSEEAGLLGAWAYAENPPLPLDNTVAVLNMDMIGRNEEVPASGGRRFRGLEPQTAESNENAVNILGHTYSADLKRAVEEANRSHELDLLMRYDNNSSNLLRRSDQWPFLQKGVPSLFFHTGLHPDYHTEFDTPERIEYDKLERIARLVHQTAWALAQADGRPAFDLLERAAAIEP